MIEWRDELSVGNEALDEDHKAFYRACEMLDDVNSSECNPAIIKTALLFLKDYLTGHFHREETAMRLADVADLEEHINEHVKFEVTLRSCIAEYEKGNDAALPNLVALATQWQKTHITLMDMNYKDIIKDENVDPRPLGLLVAEIGLEADDDVMNPAYRGIGVQ